jgi:hypothetical protein
MNKYGDAVAAETLREDPETNAKLGYPVSFEEKAKNEGAMAKVTGRLTLLKPADQQALIDKLTHNYKVLVERLDAEGANDLEAKSVDLQAKTLDSQIIKQASGASPFQSEVRLERVSAKSQGRAMEPAEVLGHVAAAQGEKLGETARFEIDISRLGENGRRKQAGLIERVKAEADAFRKEQRRALKSDDAVEKAGKQLDEALARFEDVASLAYPGNIVRIGWAGDSLPAVVIGFEKTGKAKNPVAPSSWTATFAVPDSARSLGVPLSQLYGEAIQKPEDAPGVNMLPGLLYIDTPAALAPVSYTHLTLPTN